MEKQNTFINKVINGESEKVYNPKLVKALDERPTKPKHLCWSCKNGHPFACQKITDIAKKEIQDYSFIKTGYQIVKDGRMEKFIVLGCQNYILADDASKKNFRKESNGLRKQYYRTSTVDEAFKKRETLHKSGIKLKLLSGEKTYRRQ